MLVFTPPAKLTVENTSTDALFELMNKRRISVVFDEREGSWSAKIDDDNQSLSDTPQEALIRAINCQNLLASLEEWESMCFEDSTKLLAQ